MQSLPHYLTQKDVDTRLQSIIISLATASKYINAEIRMKNTEKNRDANATGDTQSTLDLIADDIIQLHLTQTNIVKAIASEEQEGVVVNNDATEDFFVAYDPYDGGSVGDANITFGSIFGIWSEDPMGHTAGEHLVASCYTLYGPRVTFVIASGENAIALFELNEVGEFLLVRDDFSIAPEAKHFAPGNLKATTTNAQYRTIVDEWISASKKLRYSGALVTDINHILIKGDGIFTYPADEDYPTGRLRLLYEGVPLGFLLTCAGGSATDQTDTSLSEIPVTDYHQRTSLALGSKNEVSSVASKLSK